MDVSKTGIPMTSPLVSASHMPPRALTHRLSIVPEPNLHFHANPRCGGHSPGGFMLWNGIVALGASLALVRLVRAAIKGAL